jgi:hypothetical protein
MEVYEIGFVLSERSIESGDFSGYTHAGGSIHGTLAILLWRKMRVDESYYGGIWRGGVYVFFDENAILRVLEIGVPFDDM